MQIIGIKWKSSLDTDSPAPPLSISMCSNKRLLNQPLKYKNQILNYGDILWGLKVELVTFPKILFPYLVTEAEWKRLTQRHHQIDALNIIFIEKYWNLR